MSTDEYEGAPVTASVSAPAKVTYQPILDVARGVAAGYQALIRHETSDPAAPAVADGAGFLAADAARVALTAFTSLPTNTFISIPIGFRVAASAPVREVLAVHGDLTGVVLDILGFTSAEPPGELECALADYRSAGARVSVGGHGAPQPELTSIVRLKPAIIRLGRDWIRGIDNSEAKRSAIEVTGQLAGQLDAWILAEGVTTSAELRALAGLDVPLALGPFIGDAQQYWPEIEMTARTALPKATATTDGVLRGLLQQAYTTTNAVAAAQVLPETSGFDVLVVLDDWRRPTSVLGQDEAGRWDTTDVLTVNIDTPLPDAVSRAMARPRMTRFTPLVCTDNAGRFLGILRIERLMSHLADR